MQTIDVQGLAGKQGRNDVDRIDVRMPTEFRQTHASCARNVPLDPLDSGVVLVARNGSADRPLYVKCEGGGRCSA